MAATRLSEHDPALRKSILDLGNASTTTDLLYQFIDRDHLGEQEAKRSERRSL
jgi:hypothetical protein